MKTTLILTFLFFLGLGCEAKEEFVDRGSISPTTQTQDKKTQFEKGKIKIAGRVIAVEIADTDEKRAHGLMFREKLEDDTGMIFIFDFEQPLSFWMKNTLIPLSIGYFDKNKKLIDIKEMEPMSMAEKQPRTYPSKSPAQYALEMPKGWFKKNKIEAGKAKFEFMEKK